MPLELLLPDSYCMIPCKVLQGYGCDLAQSSACSQETEFCAFRRAEVVLPGVQQLQTIDGTSVVPTVGCKSVIEG